MTCGIVEYRTSPGFAFACRRPSSSSGMWQLIRWPGETSTSGGSVTSQMPAIARWQRVLKTQPGGGSAGLGISPSSRILARSSPSTLGTADNSASVYGWFGPLKTASDPPTSMIRSEVHDRDPVGQVADDAEVVRDQQVARLAADLEVREQVEDGGLHRDIERTRRFVGDDDLRVTRECACDRDPLLEAAGQLARLEVEVALGEPQVGGQPSTRSLRALPLSPVSLVTDRVRMARAVQPRLSAESGFWKTIWIERLSAVGRLALRPASTWSPRPMVPPVSGLSMPRIVLASVDLPEPDSPTSPSVSPSKRSRSTLTRAGMSCPLWWNVLDTAVTDRASAPWVDLLARRHGRLDELAQPVAMMTAGPAPGGELHDRRLDGPAQVRRELAAIDEDAGRQVRADLGEIARDGGQRALGLADAVARERAEEPEGVWVLRRLEHGRGVALLDDLARVHDPDPIAQRPDDAEVVSDEQDRRVRLGLERPDEIEDARLDGGVETRRRLVEDQELRIGRQGDGDDDALLHPARELVRVALEDPFRVADLDTAKGLERVRLGLVLALAQDAERFDDLRSHLRRRIEGRARVLIDHRGVVHPELADLVVGHLRDVVAGDQDPPAGDDRVPRQVADGGIGGGRLAAAGLADQTVRLAGLDLERHATQDGPADAADDVRQRQVLDLEGHRPGASAGGGGGAAVSIVIRWPPTAGSPR